MIVWTLLAIVALFFAGLLVQRYSRLQFCAACVAVSLTWLGLLAARGMGYAIDPILLAILLGMSVSGLFSLIKSQYPLLAFPILLTLAALAYWLVSGEISGMTMVALGIIWAFFLIVFLFRNDRLRGFAGRIVACCKQW